MLQRANILLSLGLVSSLFAQFDHLSLEHGLSQSTVKCILQDRQGYLWFGTADGLNKYDGYNFTVYRRNPRDPHLPADDYLITAICEDHTGQLWLGTGRGVLLRFDPQQERFTRYNLRSGTSPAAVEPKESADYPWMFSFFTDQTITALFLDCKDDRNTLWIGTWGYGLYKLALDNWARPELPPTLTPALSAKKETADSLAHYQHHPADPNSLSNNRVYAICRDNAGVLWVGTFGGGLNRFDEESGRFTHFKHDPNNAKSLSDNRVLSIYEDGSRTLWVGTLGGGLNKLVRSDDSRVASPPSPSNVHFMHYRHDRSSPFSLSDDDVTTILEDQYGALWVGTLGGGLNQFDRTTGLFTRFRHDPFNPHSLGDDDVVAIYEDKSGVVWIGSQLGNGVSKYDRRKEKFSHYQNDPANPSSLSDRIVWAILPPSTPNGSFIWVGTYRGGLNRLDRKTGRFTHYRHDPANPQSLSQNHVRGICEDNAGALWVGTFSEGLNKLVSSAAGGSAKFIHFRHDPKNPHSLSDNHIRALYKDRSGALWIGTFGGGLNRFDEAQARFMRYQNHPLDPHSLSDNRVYVIYQDRSSALWVGTFGGGLNKLSRNGQNSLAAAQFVRYRHDPADSNSLSDDRVLSLCEDQSGKLWIGTFGGGLNSFDPRSKKFTRFTMREGLPSDVIYGILEDGSGNLWLSTNQGLARFNPRTRARKNYDERDGLQSKEFSGGAYAQSATGEMFFGGVNGFNCFFPDSIKENLYVPPIVVTAFKKFNEAVSLGREKIELSHEDNFFALEFAALDYANPTKNQYAYKLEGFDKNWIYNGAKRVASYTNLDPGRYTFRVKGANNDGIWNEVGAAIAITIHPPFWKTWWFRLLAAGALAAMIMLIHNDRVRQKVAKTLEIEQARKAETERLRKQVADDFHDEFGQQLTNIVLFAEIIKRRLNGTAPQNVAHLNKIGDAAKSLSDGMRDFIWTLDRNKDSLYNVATRLKDFGEALFAKSKIQFESPNISPEWERVLLTMDWKRHLVQIFKEAMKNSLRHAECSRVDLQIKIKGQTLHIRLTDDGKGFDPNQDSASGLGLRYVKKRAEKIRGELSIVSQPGRGATVLFKGRMSQPEQTETKFDKLGNYPQALPKN